MEVKVVSGGVSEWEVAVKMAINFEWWWEKMNSSAQG
jgi:hypothetical protein